MVARAGGQSVGDLTSYLCPKERLLGPSATVSGEQRAVRWTDLAGRPWCARQLQDEEIYKEEPAASRQTTLQL